MPLTRLRRTAAVSIGTLALAIPAGMTGAPPAAAKYPAQVERTFMKACTRGQDTTKAEARKVCGRVYRCLERRLTFKEFVALDAALKRGKKNPPNKKVFVRCVTRAAT